MAIISLVNARLRTFSLFRKIVESSITDLTFDVSFSETMFTRVLIPFSATELKIVIIKPCFYT